MTAKKAYVEGSGGLADVQYYAGYKGFTFLEALPSGAIQTTTVTAMSKGNPLSPQLSAVHSRHTVITDLVPSQYYGTCHIKANTLN